ncbi:MAG: hypothetical protein KKC75_02210 [Nanoarchaeota archaeon]|nr:hypothetical protein [Nanoarchaeota archaeon]MBU1005534.1 hypothetical protein [Nanoarchaeota archaeon]MBU1946593.1 hypothetical protein [Nanoarchaeota archaeon]
MDKKALSPLVATLLLVVFALAIGTVTMNWGKSYVEKIKDDVSPGEISGSVIINTQDIDSPLKEIQLKYLTGKISKEEYLVQEKMLTTG